MERMDSDRESYARNTEVEYERLLILREEIEGMLERMIGLLDVIDGDPDLEPTMGDVAEGHVDEAEPDPDQEPSLGWTVGGEVGPLDSCWIMHDLEDEHDGREPDEDDAVARIAFILATSLDLDDATENVAALLEAGIRPVHVAVEVYEQARGKARQLQMSKARVHYGE